MNLSIPLSQLIYAVETEDWENIELVLEHFLACGLTGLDICTGDLKTFGIEYFKQLKQKYNINYTCVYDIVKLELENPDLLKDLKEHSKRQLEMCKILDCNIFMPVPVITKAYEDENMREYALNIIVKYLDYTAKTSKQLGIVTAVENYSDKKIPISTIDDISYILESIPDIRYIFDSGNFWFASEDILKASEKFASKTVYVHLKDIRAKEDGYLKINGRNADSVAIGEGEQPIFQCMRILKSAGYEGAYQIEINDYNKHMVSDIEASISNLKKNIEGI